MLSRHSSVCWTKRRWAYPLVPFSVWLWVYPSVQISARFFYGLLQALLLNTLRYSVCWMAHNHHHYHSLCQRQREKEPSVRLFLGLLLTSLYQTVLGLLGCWGQRRFWFLCSLLLLYWSQTWLVVFLWWCRICFLTNRSESFREGGLVGGSVLGIGLGLIVSDA